MDGNMAMFFLKVGLGTFGAEQVARVVGIGQYVPYIRLAGLATCLIRAIVIIKDLLKAVGSLS